MVVLFTGPMGCGKSAHLINVCDRLSKKYKVVAFKPNKDTRSTTIKSRNGKEIEANSVKDFDELQMQLQNANGMHLVTNCVIDEIQFLDTFGLVSFIKFVKTNKIDVYASGLNLTSELEPFDTIAKFAMYCDYVELMNGDCECCGEPSEVTKCKVEKTSEVLVGDDIYAGVCYKCHS